MRRKNPEQQLHRAVAQFLDVALPEDAWWTTIPAGGGGRVRGAILKACGYKAGTPDVCVLWNGRSIWVELKSEDGRLSSDQHRQGQGIWRAGGISIVVRSLDQLAIELAGWGIPLRASTRRAAA